MMLRIAVYVLPMLSIVAAMWTLVATVAYVQRILRARRDAEGPKA